MKKIFKKSISLAVILMLTGTLSACSNIEPITEETLKNLTDIHLGDLKDIVSSEEKGELQKLLLEAKTLEQKRLSKNKYEKSIVESGYWEKIGKLLDGYTEIYFFENEEMEDSEVVQAFNEEALEKDKDESIELESSSEYNYILQNLSTILTEEDYERVCNLYDELHSNLYNIDEIASILYKYDIKDIELICDSLIDKDVNIISNFNIKDDLRIEYNEIPFVTTKRMSKEELDYYESVWDFIQNILPEEGLKNFKRITFSTDGPDEILAYVIAVDEEGRDWRLSIDPIDQRNSNKELFLETILHEYYHYVTLNNNQVKYTEVQTTRTYNEEGMVSKEESYINGFYHKFWKDILNEKQSIPDSEYFFYRHFDDFVTEYATTSPAEDICESFAYFVLYEKPKGNTIAEQKMLFFYDYPEMVSLREELILRIQKSQDLISNFESSVAM